MGISSSIGSAGGRPGVCTSSTRPSSPYEGQIIYETDTDLTLYWSGSAWKIIGGVMPTCIITTATNQTGIIDSTWTRLTFASHTEVRNVGGFTVSTGGITIPSGLTGIYSIYGQMQWDSNATGGRGLGFATTAALGVSILSATSTGGFAFARCTLGGIAQLTAGTTYCLSAIQTSTANRSTETAFMTQTLSLTLLSQT